MRPLYAVLKCVRRQCPCEMKDLPAQQRPVTGRRINTATKEIGVALEAATKDLPAPETGGPPMDVTLPGNTVAAGAIHPITRTIEEISRIFASLGFSSVQGPEVELERYNFEALNMPLDHPARDPFDTLYLDNGTLIRCHPPPLQLRDAA